MAAGEIWVWGQMVLWNGPFGGGCLAAKGKDHEIRKILHAQLVMGFSFFIIIIFILNRKSDTRRLRDIIIIRVCVKSSLLTGKHTARPDWNASSQNGSFRNATNIHKYKPMRLSSAWSKWTYKYIPIYHIIIIKYNSLFEIIHSKVWASSSDFLIRNIFSVILMGSNTHWI